MVYYTDGTRDGYGGYDDSDFMFSSSQELSETMAPITKHGVVVKTKLVNVRKKPSRGADILTTLSSGQRVEILEAKKAFYKVRLSSGLEGYISNEFLEEV